MKTYYSGYLRPDVLLPSTLTHMYETEVHVLTGKDGSLVVRLTLIFMIFYPTHRYGTKVYLGSVRDIFPYVFIKYVVKRLPLIATPAPVLFAKRDICLAARETYIKQSIQNDSWKITCEQLQENLSIGVQREN